MHIYIFLGKMPNSSFYFLLVFSVVTALIQLKLQVPTAVGLIKKLNLITSHKTNLKLYLWISSSHGQTQYLAT